MSSKLSRRNFLKVAGLATVGGVLGACAPKELPTATPAPQQQQPTKEEVKEQPTPAPAKVVKITVHDLVAEDATGPSVFTRVKQEWFDEAFPNIEVEHLPFPSVSVEKRKEYWITALSTEGGPSAILFDNNSFTLEMAAIGNVLPLDDYLPLYYPEWEDLFPIVQEVSKYDGRVFQIPGMVEVNGLAVRRDYLEEAGYDKEWYPADYPEWSKMIKDLTTEDHWGFQWPTLDWGFGNFLVMDGGAWATEAEDKTITLHFTSTPVLETAAMFKGAIYPERHIQPDTLSDFGTNLNNFQQGSAATFNFMPSWMNWLFGTAKFLPDDLNFFPYPLGPSGKSGSGVVKPYSNVATHSWMVNPTQPNDERNAAAQYICWMNSKENIKKQAEWWMDNEVRGVYASPFKDVAWTEVSVGVPEWWGKPLQDILSYGGVSPALDFRGGDYILPALQEIVGDAGSDIEGILAQAEETCTREWLDGYHAAL